MAARCGSASECLKLGSEPAFLTLSLFFFCSSASSCFIQIQKVQKKDEVVVLLLNNYSHLFFL